MTGSGHFVHIQVHYRSNTSDLQQTAWGKPKNDDQWGDLSFFFWVFLVDGWEKIRYEDAVRKRDLLILTRVLLCWIQLFVNGNVWGPVWFSDRETRKNISANMPMNRGLLGDPPHRVHVAYFCDWDGRCLSWAHQRSYFHFFWEKLKFFCGN